MLRHPYRLNFSRTQRGNALVYTLVAAALFAFALRGYTLSQIDSRVREQGGAESTSAQVVANAAAAYVQEQYASLQPNPATPVTKNGYTLVASMSPTIADLNSLGYLSATQARAIATAGTWKLSLTRTPTGCVGAACDITGLLWLDTPVRVGTEINGTWIGGFLAKGQGNAGYSRVQSPTLISGPNWSVANPDPSQRSGIVAVRFGFGASGLGQFARLNENRPVNFTNTFAAGTTTLASLSTPGSISATGTISATGSVSSAGTVTGTGGVAAGSGTGGCARVQMTAGGQVLVNDANCNTKVTLDGATGNVTALGDVSGNQFVTPIQKVYGGACTVAGAIGTSSNGIAFCYGGVWVPYSGQQATGNTACTSSGAIAQSSSGASLICVAGLWRDEVTFGWRGAAYYAHNQTVPQPTCGSGLYPRAVISGVSASVIIGSNNPGNNTGSWQVNIDPSTWLVTITGSDGSQAGTNARALVTSFCATS